MKAIEERECLLLSTTNENPLVSRCFFIYIDIIILHVTCFCFEKVWISHYLNFAFCV